jgi:hypothetical protein
LGSHDDGDGNKLISSKFFNLLEAIDPATKTPWVQSAIKRAGKTDKSPGHQSPATEESSTTVYNFVESILKYI